MDIWHFFDGIISNPPSILILIVVTIAGSHVLDIALKFISERKQRNSLIITVELIVVIVLSALAVHSHLDGSLKGRESHSMNIEELILIAFLVFFTIISMGIYVVYRATTRDD